MVSIIYIWLFVRAQVLGLSYLGIKIVLDWRGEELGAEEGEKVKTESGSERPAGAGPTLHKLLEGGKTWTVKTVNIVAEPGARPGTRG